MTPPMTIPAPSRPRRHPALLLSGDLLIEKTPEVYYATTNTVEWKIIYLTNRGSGSAYNVWLDDVLGAGLDFTPAPWSTT